MAKPIPASFQRVYPLREFFRGRARLCLVVSALGSLALAGMLCLGALLFGLVADRGELAIPPGDIERLASLVGEELAAGLSTEARQPEGRGAQLVWFIDTGILPAVWNAAGTPWGASLRTAWRELPLLRNNRAALAVLLGLLAALGLVWSGLLSFARRISGQAAEDVAARLRRSLHRQTLRLGPGDLTDADYRKPVALFVDDIEAVRRGVRVWISAVCQHPFELVVLVVLALLANWRLALECLIPLALAWYLMNRERRRSRDVQALAAARGEAELRLLAEGLRKTRLVRGYGLEQWEHEQFQKHLDRYHGNAFHLARQKRWSVSAGRVIVLGVALVVVALIALKMLEPLDDPGRLTVPAASLLAASLVLMYGPIQTLAAAQGELSSATAAADRIHRYLDQIPDVGQAVGAKFLQPLSQSLRFEAVSYRLPGQRPLLDGVDLRLEAGKVYAVISFDPLEARTTAYLLPRFIEPQSGRVLFDSEDIAWVTLESLRAETVYVGGTDPFFTGTVRENISCGNNNYSLQDVTEAAKQTHANKFILNLPAGYETMIGEHGEHLDAGQGFRLGLARAALRNPALLIIEEPDDPLDDDTKSLLDDAYTRLLRDRTVVFLPSRMSTVRRADAIVFLHRGKVEALGGHAELVKKCPLYRHWEYLRFNEFRHQLT